jgi:hypothetical protein
MTQQKGTELEALALMASQASEFYTTVLQMTTLLHQGFEETRVMSESLREQGVVVRDDARALRQYTAQILAQCSEKMEQLEKYLPLGSGQRSHASGRLPGSSVA